MHHRSAYIYKGKFLLHSLLWSLGFLFQVSFFKVIYLFKRAQSSPMNEVTLVPSLTYLNKCLWKMGWIYSYRFSEVSSHAAGQKIHDNCRKANAYYGIGIFPKPFNNNYLGEMEDVMESLWLEIRIPPFPLLTTFDQGTEGLRNEYKNS